MTNEEAVKILKKARLAGIVDVDINRALDMAIKALEQEPKTGHWSDECECSVCGNQPWYEGSTFRKNYKFCPYCGVRMESEGEE